MKFLLQLSGEHPALPKAEIAAVLEGEGINYDVIYENRKTRILIIDAKTKNTEFLQRLAMTTKAAEFVAMSCDLIEISERISRRIPNHKTFAVRSESHRIEEELGERIRNLERGVNLTNPDLTILCFYEKKKYITGIEIPLERDFNSRKPQLRPFFHPTSMHPKIARLLVNLARVKRGNKILDPFCGTGGILIEAGLMGMKILGSDIDERMVEGCRKNLDFYNITGEIDMVNATEIDKRFNNIDAIVTDPPYGRSSAVFGKRITRKISSQEIFVPEKSQSDFWAQFAAGKFGPNQSKALIRVGIYNDFLKSAANVIKSNGRIVIVTPMEFLPKLKEFRTIGRYNIRVHKSLTRRILVLRKIK